MLDGIDLVSYFVDLEEHDGAVSGVPSIASTFAGYTFYRASNSTRSTFRARPTGRYSRPRRRRTCPKSAASAGSASAASRSGTAPTWVPTLTRTSGRSTRWAASGSCTLGTTHHEPSTVHQAYIRTSTSYHHTSGCHCVDSHRGRYHHHHHHCRGHQVSLPGGGTPTALQRLGGHEDCERVSGLVSWFGEGATLLNTYCYYNSDDDV